MSRLERIPDVGDTPIGADIASKSSTWMVAGSIGCW